MIDVVLGEGWGWVGGVEVEVSGVDEDVYLVAATACLEGVAGTRHVASSGTSYPW